MLNSSINKNKVGRNQPCPCGSGKKYKMCCDSNNTKLDYWNNKVDFDEMKMNNTNSNEKLDIKKVNSISIPMFKDKSGEYINQTLWRCVEKIIGEMRGTYRIDLFSKPSSITLHFDYNPFDEKEWFEFLDKIVKSKTVKSLKELFLLQDKTDKTQLGVMFRKSLLEMV